jgi:hypothetical protein
MGLRRAAPWEFMLDSFNLGLRDPATASVRIASVLGAAKQVFGVVFYRHEGGLRFVLRARCPTAQAVSDDTEMHLSQDAVKVDFVSKTALRSREKRLWSELGFMPPPGADRRNAWPQFESHLPGYVPWFIDEAEAGQLLHDLPRVLAFAELCRGEPELFIERMPSEIPFWPEGRESGAPLRVEELEWHFLHMPPPGPPETFMPAADELKALRELPIDPNLIVELESFVAPTGIGEGARPWLPTFCLVADAASGLILQMEMAKQRGVAVEHQAGVGLCATLRTLGQRPARVHVARQRLVEALAPLAKALELGVQERRRLPVIDFIRKELEGSFRR